MNSRRLLYKTNHFCCGVVLFSLLLLSEDAYGAINNYIYPKSAYPSYSNYGTIGLIQMPNARLMPAGSLAVSWSRSDPYYRGSFVAYPFSWFEASYQYTDVNNALYSDIQAFSGKQTYKDKSFDAKFLIFKEKELLPAIAVGARDMAGTGMFSSEYIVGSKRLGNIDFTMGLGWGAISRNGYNSPFRIFGDQFKFRKKNADSLGGEFNLGYFFSGNAALFGGIEWYLPNLRGLRLKLEYDTTDYDIEGFPDGRQSFKFAFEPVKRESSHINIGIVYPLTEFLHLKLAYIKGNTLNLGISMQMDLSSREPFIKKFDGPKRDLRYSETIKKVSAKSDLNLYKASLRYLADEGFYLQHANLENKELEIVYTQSKYASYMRGAGRAFRILDNVTPENVEKFKLSNINGGMGMYSIEIDRESFRKFDSDNLYPLLERNTSIKSYSYNKKKTEYAFNPKTSYPMTFWKLAPSVRSQIGGPDGFYFGDLRLAFHSETLFNRNISFITSMSSGIYNNFDELKLASDSILPHVRSDQVKYLKQSESFGLQRAQLNYFLEPYKSIYAKFSAGIFEEMFGGIGAEILWKPFNKNFGIGAEIFRVKQRDYDMRLDFNDYMTTTGFINFHYIEPRSQVIFALKAGRFLAKDSGFNFDFSRRFNSGARIGAFFSLTDISEVEFGEGSFDKGFYFHIPIEIFFSNYQKGTSNFGLRPITRDGAAILNYSHHLRGVTDQAGYNSIARDWPDIYD